MLAAQPTPYRRMMDRSHYTQEEVDAALEEYAAAASAHGPAHKESIALRNKIVLWHMRAAVKLASRYHAPGMELDDWVAYAVLGLIRAVELFDAANEATFLTYASFRMREQMSLAYRTRTTTIRVPKLEHARAKQGDADAAEGIARAKYVESSDAPRNRPDHYDVAGHGRLLSEASSAFASDEASAFDKFAEAELHSRVVETLDTLDAREREIMLRRADGETLQEVADALNTSRQRVHQLETKARATTRKTMARLTGESVCSGA